MKDAAKCPHNIICGNDSGGWWCGQCNANISRYYVNKYVRGKSKTQPTPKKGRTRQEPCAATMTDKLLQK